MYHNLMPISPQLLPTHRPPQGPRRKRPVPTIRSNKTIFWLMMSWNYEKIWLIIVSTIILWWITRISCWLHCMMLYNTKYHSPNQPALLPFWALMSLLRPFMYPSPWHRSVKKSFQRTMNFWVVQIASMTHDNFRYHPPISPPGDPVARNPFCLGDGVSLAWKCWIVSLADWSIKIRCYPYWYNIDWYPFNGCIRLQYR